MTVYNQEPLTFEKKNFIENCYIQLYEESK